jgi:hypothetical protein
MDRIGSVIWEKKFLYFSHDRALVACDDIFSSLHQIVAFYGMEECVMKKKLKTNRMCVECKIF